MQDQDSDGALSNVSSINVSIANTLQVTSFQPTPTGFIATFNRQPDFGDLNLYDSLLDGSPTVLDSPDVVVHGASTGDVVGSLVWRSAGNTLEFVKTGAVLANDTYTVTLFSGATAFHDAAGNLDGDGDFNDTETPDNYTNGFVVNNAAGTRVISVNDFARGPGQHIDDKPATANSRLAVSINDATDVISAQFNFRYDPTMLTVNAANTVKAAGLPGGYHRNSHRWREQRRAARDSGRRHTAVGIQ